MVDEVVRLDLNEAYSAIDNLFLAFAIGGQEAATALGQAIHAQLDDLQVGVDVTLADADALGQYVDAAVANAGPVVDIDPNIDVAAIMAEIEGAAAQAEPVAEVQIDPAAIQQDIEAAVADVPPVEIDAEVAVTGGDQVQDVGNKAAATSQQMDGLTASFAATRGAAALATGNLQGAGQAIGGLNQKIAGAAGAVAAIGVVIGQMVGEAAQAQASLVATQRVFGDFAGAVETIQFGNFTGGLSDVALALGADDDAMRITLANIGRLAIGEGKTQQEAAALASQFGGLATVISATHPQLGTTATVLDTLIPRLARGGKFVTDMGLSFTAADIAMEAQREGISKSVNEMTILERDTLALKIANQQLGKSAAQDVASGMDLALVRIRAFRQEIRESLETQGGALLGPLLNIAGDLIPVIEEVAGVIGRVTLAAAEFFGPIIKEEGPQIAGVLKDVGAAIEVLIPILHVAGEAVALLLLPFSLVSQAVDRLISVIRDALPAALKAVERAAVDSLQPMIDGINKVIEGINKISPFHDIGKIHFDSSDLDHAATAADTTVAAVQNLADGSDLYAQSTQSAIGAAAQFTESLLAQQYAARTATGALSDGISSALQSSRVFAGELLDLRGNSDQAFFALLKLGDKAPEAIRDLATGLQRGGLDANEFKAEADRLGLSLDDLAAIEKRVGDEQAAIADQVGSAIGDITDATSSLDDEGKAHIDSFVTELETQLTASAGFAANIAVLYQTHATALAAAFEKAGPDAAGALQELVDKGGPAITSLEGDIEGLTSTLETNKATAVKAAQDTGAGIADGLKPDQPVIEQGIDEAMLGAQAALANKQDAAAQTAHNVGYAISTGVVSGIQAGSGAVQAAIDQTIDGALLSAQARAQIGSPSRLFANDVGIPLTEGLAEGIRAGFFNVDDAVRDVIDAAQQTAQSQLQTAFGALRAGRSLDQAQQHLTDLRQQQADLLAQDTEISQEAVAAKQELNKALTESAEITAREQQSIERAQATIESIKASMAEQAQAGSDLPTAQSVLSLDQADLARLRTAAQESANNLILGTTTPEADRAAQQAFTDQQRRVADQQRVVDQLTQTMKQNRFTQTDLQVATEDLAQAQADAVGPTDRVREAQQALKDLEDKATQTKAQLRDVTNQLPDALIAVLEATAGAALAGDKFNRTGLASLGVLGDIAKQAGFTDQAIAGLTKTWAGLSSTIATSLGGGAFGAPPGQVDIGSILGTGQRFVDPQQALDELNFVRGINGQGGLTMQQAPWNINIYQANDPVVLAGTMSAVLGLAGVR